MAASETTDDLLIAARENHEFREAFRREILTEKFMAVPGLDAQTNPIAVSTSEHAATTLPSGLSTLMGYSSDIGVLLNSNLIGLQAGGIHD